MQLSEEEIETFAFPTSQIFLSSKKKKEKKKTIFKNLNKNLDFLIDYF